MVTSLNPFPGPEHEPYEWAGTNGAAALLVHGFPGTPIELRTVGEWLHGCGWTVRGLLLPGFGRQFFTIGEQRAGDWLAVVSSSLRELRARSERLLVVGNSMGSALALAAAAKIEVDGIILFAPFWRVNSRAVDAAFPAIRRLLPQIHAFRRADFARPDVREVIDRFLPDADIDDPEVQAAIRALALPTSVLGEVRHAGRLGYAAAPDVRAPVLVLQGANDILAHPAMTKELLARLPNVVGYVEVASNHELAHMRYAHEHALEPVIAAFATSLAR